MSYRSEQDPTVLAAALLRRPAAQRAAWIRQHPAAIGLELIAALKTYSDPLALSDSAAADEATRCALLVAQFCREQPLTAALAAWARGNWVIFHDPQRAIQWYEQALQGYRQADDSLSIAHLLTNLVFPYTECGRLPEAQLAADEARARLAELGTSGDSYLMTLEHNTGWMLHHQGRYADALAAYDRALTLAWRLNQPAVAAEIQVNRTVTLKLVGSLSDVEALLLESRAVAEAHQQHLTVARIDMNIGELYAAQGRPGDALRRLHTARRTFAALDNQMELAWVLWFEAGLLSRIGALHAANRCYERAQVLFAALDLQPQVGKTLIRRAICYRQQGRSDQAVALLAQAERLGPQFDQLSWQATVRLEQAEVALQRGALDLALDLVRPVAAIEGHAALEAQRAAVLADAYAARWQRSGDLAQRAAARCAYQDLLRQAQARSDRCLERRALAGLGQLCFTDDPAQARRSIEAALALDDATRQALTVEELKASVHQRSADLLTLLVRLSAAEAQPLATLQVVWRAKASALLDLLQETDSYPAGSPEEEAEIECVRQQLALQRWQLGASRTADASEADRERGSTTIRQLEDQLSDLRRRLRHAGPNIAADPALTLAQMQADVLLEYMRCDDRLLLIRAERDGRCELRWLGPVRPIQELAEQLQLQLQHVVSQSEQRRQQHSAAWLAECRPLLRRLYELLIAPLTPIPDGATVAIAACEPLLELPFAALWSGSQYLVERWTIQHTPCGALLGLPRLPPACGPALIIAASAEGRLPAVCDEAARVQALLPDAAVLIDDPQTLTILRQRTDPPQLVHIAAHSIVREDAPLFSGLQLTNEVLSVEHCYDLPLRGTRLVLLSGCSTAGPDSAGALPAFQSALFVAGAQAVVSALWQIDDRAAVQAVELFYRSLLAGRSPAAALREAQLALLDSTSTSHPAIWAALVCSTR